MSKLQNLINRLEDRRVCSLAHNSCYNDFTMQEAARALATQAAEIERLTRERDEAAFERDAAASCMAAAETARNAAEAERDALRDALRSIEGMVANATSAPMTAERWLDRIEERARAALGGQP